MLTITYKTYNNCNVRAENEHKKQNLQNKIGKQYNQTPFLYKAQIFGKKLSKFKSFFNDKLSFKVNSNLRFLFFM